MHPFPISMQNPAEHRATLPETADVVVVGGGVIGVCTALFLARAGRRVVLLEKGRIAGEQSGRNWGWIRVQGRDPAEIPIALEAQKLWRRLAPELDVDIGLMQTGVAYLARDEAGMEGFRAWIQQAAPYGVTTRLLDSAETAHLLPKAVCAWAGAMWTPTDLRAEPFLAVPALARLAAGEGVLIREGCAVRTIDASGGAVTGVHTEEGRIAAPEVVVAGGAWSSLLLRRHGIRLPQLSVHATAMRTSPLKGGFDGAAVDHRIAFRQRADGGYTLAPESAHSFYLGPDAFRFALKYLPLWRAHPFATRFRLAAPQGAPDAWGTSRRLRARYPTPFEATRILDPAPDARQVRAVARAFAKTFPALGEVGIESAWGGMIDVMPDVVPVVDRAGKRRGLTVATGMSAHGFGIGPAFGRIVADLVMGREPGHDMARFRLSRFSDGSGLAPGPSL